MCLIKRNRYYNFTVIIETMNETETCRRSIKTITCFAFEFASQLDGARVVQCLRRLSRINEFVGNINGYFTLTWLQYTKTE